MKVRTLVFALLACSMAAGCEERGSGTSGTATGALPGVSTTAAGPGPGAPTASTATGGDVATGPNGTGANGGLNGPAARPEDAPAPQEIDPKETPGMSRRSTIKAVSDDPALYANRDFIARTWGVVQLPLPLSLQEVTLPHERRALLFIGAGPALNKPIVLVVGADNQVVWSKERPLLGTHEQPRDMALSRGPRGEVFVFWYDEPTKIFAARSWTYDGGIFADFVLLSAERCDSLNALHWPGQGWVGALLSDRTLHVQLIGENGARTWPENGIDVLLGPAPGGAKGEAVPVVRPQIAIQKGDTIEITVAGQKIRMLKGGILVK